MTGRGLLTALGHASVAPGVTGLGLRTDIGHGVSVSCPSFAREVDVTGRGHAISLGALVAARGHGCGRFSPLTSCSHGLVAGEPGGMVW